MNKKTNSRSIFSQKLDRAIFVTYFLGAIVPLMALGVASHTYVFPVLRSDPSMTIAMLVAMSSVSLISLGAFFALRRLANGAVVRMNQDNARLKGILSVSTELSTSLHTHAVLEVAASSARRLTSAEVALVLMRAGEGKPLAMVASSGEQAQKLFQANEELIGELVESTIATRTATALVAAPSSRAAAANSPDALGTAVAFPLLADHGSCGSVVVLRASTANGRFPAAEQDALMTLSVLTGVALRNVSLQDAQRNFFAHITDLLVASMDAHIDGRRGHATSVAELSNRLARELSLPEPRMQRLHFAALLHDIGMLKIAQAHQRAPGHFQKHPQIAHRVLSRIRLWEEAAPIVLHHHEWFDGSGYPEARSGEEIPIESRIIAVADCYDALLRPDAHRMAMTSEGAVSEICDRAGSQFDPQVATALEQLALRDELPDSTH